MWLCLVMLSRVTDGESRRELCGAAEGGRIRLCGGEGLMESAPAGCV